MSPSVFQSNSTITPTFVVRIYDSVVVTSTPMNKEVAPSVTFHCHECPRQFSRRYALQEHLASHTGEKAYQCPARGCGKCFTTTSNLARHRHLHGEELQPLVCPVLTCAKTFSTPHKLQRHLRRHSSPPTHRCEFANCTKTFSSTGNLNRHVRNQHIQFGHSLAKGTMRMDSTNPRTDKGCSRRFARGSTSPTSVSMDMTVFDDNVLLDSGHGRRVSNEELLEVLSCLLDDGESDGTTM